jgi:hypothetical protein
MEFGRFICPADPGRRADDLAEICDPVKLRSRSSAPVFLPLAMICHRRQRQPKYKYPETKKEKTQSIQLQKKKKKKKEKSLGLRSVDVMMSFIGKYQIGHVLHLASVSHRKRACLRKRSGRRRKKTTTERRQDN